MSSGGTGQTSQRHGMKNTTDPRAKDPIDESAGPVASDSLAAESYNAGGDFAENRNAAPSGVSGEASTFNTTDTSAANKLDAARDAGERDDGYDKKDLGPGGVKYPEGLGGQPDFPGATTSQGYVGGPTGGNYNSRGGRDGDNTSRSGGKDSSDGDNDSGAGENTSSSAGVAPTYITDVYLGRTGKPKGKNLTEDDNLEGKRQTDFEIGGKDDPGRAALQNFEISNASVATGQSNKQRDIDGDNTYSDLKSDDQA